jgi:hypothetical protein
MPSIGKSLKTEGTQWTAPLCCSPSSPWMLTKRVKPVTCVSSLDRESPLVLYWLLVGQRRRALKQ